MKEKDIKIGKWYYIKYGKKGSKSAYHGPAQCLGRDDLCKEGFVFRHPTDCRPEPVNAGCLSRMLFLAQDVKKEVKSKPTYNQLLWLIRIMKKEAKRMMNEHNIESFNYPIFE
jgi:hypothetical protein